MVQRFWARNPTKTGRRDAAAGLRASAVRAAPRGAATRMEVGTDARTYQGRRRISRRARAQLDLRRRGAGRRVAHGVGRRRHRRGRLGPSRPRQRWSSGCPGPSGRSTSCSPAPAGPRPARWPRSKRRCSGCWARGSPADPRVTAALNDVLDSLRALIERLIADPGATSANTLNSLAERFNELSRDSSSSSTGPSAGTIPTPVAAAVLGTSASGSTRRHQAPCGDLPDGPRARAARREDHGPLSGPGDEQLPGDRARAGPEASVDARTPDRDPRGQEQDGPAELHEGRSARHPRGGRLSGVVRTKFGTTTLTSARATRRESPALTPTESPRIEARPLRSRRASPSPAALR